MKQGIFFESLKVFFFLSIFSLSAKANTSYFDPHTQTFVPVQNFQIDQETCSLEFSFLPDENSAERQIVLNERLLMPHGIIFSGANDFAACKNPTENLACEIFFRKKPTAPGFSHLIDSVLNFMACENSILQDTELEEFEVSWMASCDPDGKLELSEEDSTDLQLCLLKMLAKK